MSAFGKVAEAELITASSKSQRIVWFISSSVHVVSYLQKESVVCYPCFNRQQAKNTGNHFAVTSTMNGIQLEKYLWANAESPITVPLYRICKKLDSLICTKYETLIVVAMATVKE